MSKINYSGEPNSCDCGAVPTPHSHIETDGRSHNIRPDIPMKDSQDWLDIDEVLENLWYEAAHGDGLVGWAVEKAKSAIREHFLKEALELINGVPKLILKGKFEDDMGLFGDYVEVAELRNKFNDKYKED